jgi:hypothetical protein
MTDSPPNNIIFCLDLNSQKTLVQLPMTLEGKLGKVKLTCWDVKPIPVPPEPYFQIRFSDGLITSNVSSGYHTGIRNDSIQVPWSVATNMSWPFPISNWRMMRSRFTVELYDSLGLPYTPTRCVLWLEIELK